ncbi:hypothetical protein GCM10022222_73100 [Amycolatopsis ultiminotia]|uniref:Uncharacterized protein n=2 Tax=Amycolatopsis ultiminotia TaxID=543629 RepID=A0ABP6Y5P2_9PSEU
MVVGVSVVAGVSGANPVGVANGVGGGNPVGVANGVGGGNPVGVANEVGGGNPVGRSVGLDGADAVGAADGVIGVGGANTLVRANGAGAVERMAGGLREQNRADSSVAGNFQEGSSRFGGQPADQLGGGQDDGMVVRRRCGAGSEPFGALGPG